MTRQGTWSSSGGCESSQRGNAQTPHYAKFFTFKLSADAEVTINLSSSQDTYLYVLSGHGTAGERLYHNDDADYSTYDSHLSVEMDAGDYTIEATTYSARRSGSFTLKVATDLDTVAAATVTGLAARHSATVGEQFDTSFGYTPDTATPSVQSVTPAGLELSLTPNSGQASMSGTPTLAGTYTATIALIQTGRVDTHSITVEVACPEGHTQQSDRSCQTPPATVTGLAGSHSAIVGEPFDTSFTYAPTSTGLSVASVAPTGLELTLTHRRRPSVDVGHPHPCGHLPGDS